MRSQKSKRKSANAAQRSLWRGLCECVGTVEYLPYTSSGWTNLAESIFAVGIVRMFNYYYRQRHH